MNNDYLSEIKIWSKTFYIPISKLPNEFREAVGALYLGLRAVDEIEDHNSLNTKEKVNLLKEVSLYLQLTDLCVSEEKIDLLFEPYKDKLPHVTLNICRWINVAPKEVRHRISDCIASMALRIIPWVQNNWTITDSAALDSYTYSVSGTPGLTLCELFDWYENKKTDRTLGVKFGVFLQNVNILRGRKDDAIRNVDFYPKNWTDENMIKYTYSFISDAKIFIESLSSGSSYEFCKEIFEMSVFAFEKLKAKEHISFDGEFKP